VRAVLGRGASILRKLGSTVNSCWSSRPAQGPTLSLSFLLTEAMPPLGYHLTASASVATQKPKGWASGLVCGGVGKRPHTKEKGRPVRRPARTADFRLGQENRTNFRPAEGGKAEPGKAQHQHRPGRRLRDRRSVREAVGKY
jgi:hypothetical protein